MVTVVHLIFAFVTALGGSAATIAIAFRWLWKPHLDRQLAADRRVHDADLKQLEDRLARKLSVANANFDAEFKRLELVQAEGAELLDAMARITNAYEYQDRTAAAQSPKREFARQAEVALSKFALTARKSRPFLPVELNELLLPFLSSCDTEVKAFRGVILAEAGDPHAYDQKGATREAFAKFGSLSEDWKRVENAIRSRLAALRESGE